MHQDERGFSLLEIMIAIAVVSVILTSLFVLFFSSQDVFSFSRERVKFQRAHRLIYSWVSRYARKAIFINDNPAGIDEIQLEFVQEDNADGIAFGLDDDGYFYYRKRVSGTWGNQKRIIDMQGHSLSFSFNQNILNISLTLINGTEEYSFNNKFFPRYTIVETP